MWPEAHYAQAMQRPPQDRSVHWSSGLFRPLGKLLPAPLMSLQRGQPLNKKLFTFVNTSEKDTYRAGATDGLEPVPSRWSLVPTSNPSLLSYPSVQYLARRDTPPLPVAPNRGHTSLTTTLTKGKLYTVFRKSRRGQFQTASSQRHGPQSRRWTV